MDSWARVRRNYHLGTTSIDQEVAITKLATKIESTDSSLVKSPMMHSSPLIKPDSIARPPPDGMWWYYAPIFLCGPYPRKIYGEDILVYELFPGWAAVKTTALYIWPRTRIRVHSAANLAKLYRRLVSPNSLTPVRDTCRIRTIFIKKNGILFRFENGVTDRVFNQKPLFYTIFTQEFWILHVYAFSLGLLYTRDFWQCSAGPCQDCYRYSRCVFLTRRILNPSLVCLCSRMFWPPMRTLPLGDPWIRGFYSISGGCRDSHLFYTTVHHGKQRCVLLTRLHLHPHARKHQPLARKRGAGLKLWPHLMCIIVP